MGKLCVAAIGVMHFSCVASAAHFFIWEEIYMADFYRYPIKRPRTIDTLEIRDCIEIIIKDLARYGIPDELAVAFVSEHFMPVKKMADILVRRSSLHLTALMSRAIERQVPPFHRSKAIGN